MSSSAHIWSQSVARRSMMGHERTHNPSPAAAFLLEKRYGKKGLARAVAFLKKRRRSAYRGNPVAALAAPVAESIIGHIPGLKNLLKKHSEDIARGLAPSIVASANAGNLTAARGLLERAAIPMIVKEHAVWAAAAQQLSPKIVAAVKKYADQIPQASQANPAAFAQSLTPEVSLQQIEAEAASHTAAQKAEAAAARRQTVLERQATLGTVAGVATAGLQALARRSVRRSPQRRRRRY